MKTQYSVRLFLFTIAIFCLHSVSFGQVGLLKRTTYKTETIEFGVGGTLTVIGSPNGSIEVEGWNKKEISIAAEITVQAANESDLATLASVVGYLADTGVAHTRIISVGPNDKSYLKTVAKKFPKHLLLMPFRIDYKIMVPVYCDLEINGGNGDLTISKVEGTMGIRAIETNAKLDLVAGTVVATFGSGSVEITIPKPSWRGRNLDFQLVKGTMNVNLPKNLNADVDAKVLGNGKVENSLIGLKKRDRTEFSDKLIMGKSGSGGVHMSFMVSEGTIHLKESGNPIE